MNEKLAIGIDFGGTKILAGVVNLDTGRLVGTGKKKTRHPQEQDDLIKRIASVVDEAMIDACVSAKDLVGIGIGAAGMIDRSRGVLLTGVNLGLNEVAIAAPLASRYGLPCVLGNDVEAATLGELHFGAGRGCDSFICVFVGTGIGSGIVIDGKIFHGATGTAGEIGHMTLIPFGRPCNCGSFGCLEVYASRMAIAKQIVQDLSHGAESTIRDKIDPNKGILRSKAIANAMEAKDELVVSVVTEAARFMGVGLANVVNMLNPKRIILGGGLVEAVAPYFDIAAREAKLRALKIASKKLDIVRAELGDYAGIVGAALLMKNAADQLARTPVANK